LLGRLEVAFLLEVKIVAVRRSVFREVDAHAGVP
jgi:hypothetical protein